MLGVKEAVTEHLVGSGNLGLGYAIREEIDADAAAIRRVTIAAFRSAKHSDGNEAAIVDALRAAGVIAVSLVATIAGEVVGHIAFSPVTIDGAERGWFGLGPVSVMPDLQRGGIGSALVRQGLQVLRRTGAKGCVVFGNPGFYRRFGFRADPAIRLEGVSPEFFMWMSLDGSMAAGRVAYHASFSTQ